MRCAGGGRGRIEFSPAMVARERTRAAGYRVDISRWKSPNDGKSKYRTSTKDTRRPRIPSAPARLRIHHGAAHAILMELRRFVRSTRAGSTALAAAAVTVMAVGGGVLVGDHVWLTDQRDTLKSAADAAGVAATIELTELLKSNPGVSDAALKSELQSVAERFVKLNLGYLPPDRYAKAMATLVVEVFPDRGRRTVDVSVRADLGGSLFAGQMPFLGGYSGPEDGIQQESRAETYTSPVEVVLAIDISGSMNADLRGKSSRRGSGDRRIDIVQRAAKSLVEILNPNPADRVAVAIVPWNLAVRLDATAASTWATNRWARYPTRRAYGVPYTCKPAGNCTPPALRMEDLPSTAPEAWTGCLDGDRMGSGASTRASLPLPGEFFSLPSANPFAQRYFHPSYGFTYSCLVPPLPSDLRNQICYERNVNIIGLTLSPPQLGCTASFPTILPLTTTKSSVVQAIDSLVPTDGRTYSALGVLWGQRLLQHTWRTAWGGSIHPVDPDAPESVGLRKAIVLLTDGEDTHCGTGNYDCSNSPVGVARATACAEAKARGTEIFVVAAMHPNKISGAFGTSLTACSSQSDRPDGTYVFLNNSTKESLESAFAEIGNQLRTVRRVH